MNINVFSSLSDVTAAARSLATRIFNHYENEAAIKADRKVLLDWFLADPFRAPEQIEMAVYRLCRP